MKYKFAIGIFLVPSKQYFALSKWYLIGAFFVIYNEWAE